MTRRFSKQHKSFSDWKKGRKPNKYVNRITEAHAINPKWTLVRLRKARMLNHSMQKWESLPPSHRAERIRALSILSEVRKGKALQKAIKQFGFSLQEVKKHLGGTISFRNNRWIARKVDRIERAMVIYTNGKRKTIVIDSSKAASKVGEYYNSVKKFLQTHNQKEVQKVKPQIKDRNGKIYHLETDPQKILDIEEAKEEPELTEIYSEDE